MVIKTCNQLIKKWVNKKFYHWHFPLIEPFFFTRTRRAVNCGNICQISRTNTGRGNTFTIINTQVDKIHIQNNGGHKNLDQSSHKKQPFLKITKRSYLRKNFLKYGSTCVIFHFSTKPRNSLNFLTTILCCVALRIFTIGIFLPLMNHIGLPHGTHNRSVGLLIPIKNTMLNN